MTLPITPALLQRYVDRFCVSADRLTVLRALAEGPGRTVEVGHRVGLEWRTVLRHCSELQGMGATCIDADSQVYAGFIWQIDTDMPAGRLALALVQFLAAEEARECTASTSTLARHTTSC